MKRKRRGWTILFALFFLAILAWVTAFVGWLFWEDVRSYWAKLTREKTVSEQSRKPAKESISEEERKKLDEILRRKQQR